MASSSLPVAEDAPVDSKKEESRKLREEFKKYLDNGGAMDTLTKVLVKLYEEPERPTNALEYIRKHLGDSTEPDKTELNALKSELEDSRSKAQNLENEIKGLREVLAKHEPEGDTTVVEEENDGEQSIGGGSGMGDALPAEGAETAANTSAEVVSQPAPQ